MEPTDFKTPSSTSTPGGAASAREEIERQQDSSDQQEDISSSSSCCSSSPFRRGRPRLTRLESLSVQLDVSEMLEKFLYLGAKGISEDGDALNNLGIGYIINCTLEAPNHFEERGILYLQVSVDDSATANIAPFFSTAGKFIEQARLSQSKVLVHCTMGMSRSSTIVLAYLMEYKRMSLKEAIEMAKERRAMVSPNSGFMKQLCDFEMQLFGKQTVDIDKYKKSRFAEVSAFAL